MAASYPPRHSARPLPPGTAGTRARRALVGGGAEPAGTWAWGGEHGAGVPAIVVPEGTTLLLTPPHFDAAAVGASMLGW